MAAIRCLIIEAMKRTKYDLWWLLFWASMPLWLCGGFFGLVANLPKQPPTAQNPHYMLEHVLLQLQKSDFEGPQYILSGTEAQFGNIKIAIDGNVVRLTGPPEEVRRAYAAIGD